ncbi:uncharacterized [Tachysurus ichikawai]
MCPGVSWTSFCNQLVYHVSLAEAQRWSDFPPDGGHLLALFSFICCGVSIESFEATSSVAVNMHMLFHVS